MSDSADLDQNDARSSRGSRRAKRQAEREAERVALLTGQQPLLTRREMRRLREEAEALKAAVAAGEITPEEARALQNPLAAQPVIEVASVTASGQHAEPGQHTESAEHDEAGQHTEIAEHGEAGQDAEAGQHAGPGQHAEPGPQMADATLTEADVETISALETGELSAVDLRADAPELAGLASRAGDTDMSSSARTPSSASPATADTAAGVAGSEEVEGTGLWATVPERRPLAERVPIEGGAFSADSAELPAELDDDAPSRGTAHGTHAAEAPGSLREAEETGTVDGTDGVGSGVGADRAGTSDGADGSDDAGGAGSETEAVGADSNDGDAVVVDDLDDEHGQEPADGDDAAGSPILGEAPDASGTSDAAGAPDAAAAPDAAGAATQAGLARRPIVRIPAAAQGVRTVDADTGQLSSITPVGEGFTGIENPQWRALRSPATTGGTPAHSAGSTTDGPSATGTAPEAGAADDGTGVGTAAQPAGTAGVFGPTSSGPDAVSAAATPDSAAREAEKSSSSRPLLIALVTIVVILAVATIIWFMTRRGSDSSAAVGLLRTLVSLRL